MENQKWFCYILQSENKTYAGSTNNLKRRIKQHNGILKGGAKATRGKTWTFYVILTGFKTHQNALQCEWKIKHPTGKKNESKYRGTKGRIKGLNEMLCQDKWTNQSTINNSDCDYTLYISKNVIDELNQNVIPPNINVVCVDDFDSDYIDKIN